MGKLKESRAPHGARGLKRYAPPQNRGLLNVSVVAPRTGRVD